MSTTYYLYMDRGGNFFELLDSAMSLADPTVPFGTMRSEYREGSGNLTCWTNMGLCINLEGPHTVRSNHVTETAGIDAVTELSMSFSHEYPHDPQTLQLIDVIVGLPEQINCDAVFSVNNDSLYLVRKNSIWTINSRHNWWAERLRDKIICKSLKFKDKRFDESV